MFVASDLACLTLQGLIHFIELGAVVALPEFDIAIQHRQHFVDIWWQLLDSCLVIVVLRFAFSARFIGQERV